MLAFRTVEYAAIFITLVALYRASRLWLSETESLIGTVIFALYYAYGRWDCMGQRDNFAVLPIILGGYFFVKAARRNDSRPHDGLLLLGGAMIGAATCIRPTFALLLAVPFLSLYRIPNVRAWAAAFVGFCIPIFLMLLPYILTPGGIQQAYLSAILYNSGMFSHVPSSAWVSSYVSNLLGLRELMVFILGGIWILLYVLRRRRKKPCGAEMHRELMFLALFVATLLIGMFGQPHVTAYHFTPFYACFIPVLTKTFSDETRILGRWRFWVLSVALLFIGAVLYPTGLVRSFVEGSFSIDAAYRYFPGTIADLHEKNTIALFLERHTTPDQYVQVIGDPGVSWRTPRRESSRFESVWCVLPHDSSGHMINILEEWQAGYLESLRKKKPRYIVIDRDPGRTARSLFAASAARNPEIKHYIQHDYFLDTLFPGHAIYARR